MLGKCSFLTHQHSGAEFSRGLSCEFSRGWSFECNGIHRARSKIRHQNWARRVFLTLSSAEKPDGKGFYAIDLKIDAVDPQVEVFIPTARSARRRPHQLPRQAWPAPLLRGRSLERLPSVAMLEQSQDLSKHRSRGNTSCQDPIVQPVDPRHPLFETTSLLP